MISSIAGLVLGQGRAESGNLERTCPPESQCLPCPMEFEILPEAECCELCLSSLTSWLERLEVVASSRKRSCLIMFTTQGSKPSSSHLSKILGVCPPLGEP